MQAAMMYLRVLREAHGLSQADVARVAGVDSKQVYRWERGESEPSATRLVAFVQAVRGNIEQVWRLITEPDATEDLGRQLAHEILDSVPPNEREQRRLEAIALIDSLLADPKKLDRLLGYGERLQEE